LDIANNSGDNKFIKQNKAIASFLKSSFDVNKKVKYNIEANERKVIDYFLESLPYTTDKVNPQVSFLNNTVKYKAGYDLLLKQYSSIKDEVHGWLNGTVDAFDVKTIDYTNINTVLDDLTFTKSYE
jgi:hypothetical protein